jgi:hypothetical protein
MTFGRILESDALHSQYRQHLTRVLDGGFARFPLL